MDIGFIGLGRMGFPMVRRLVEAGHRLFVHDIAKDAVERAAALGATAVDSPARVADAVETVFVSLPTPDIVFEIATGKDGVIEGRRVRRMVDLSTTGPRTAIRVAEALAKKSIIQIDCPVSGGVGGANKGTLALMASGPRAEIWLIEPVLAALGKLFVVGEKPGMGQTMKLCNNLLTATAMAATSEAMVFGAKSGLDPVVMLDVINSGTGRNSASVDKFPRSIVTGTFDYGFATALMMKDVKLALDEAQALGVPTEVCSAVGRLWQLTCDEVGPDKDFTTIVQPLERRAGVEVRAKDKA
jgi:3-hydroxyisobutyrate dehydrogenase-like beta-hydroxyacid dehydrogenase